MFIIDMMLCVVDRDGNMFDLFLNLILHSCCCNTVNLTIVGLIKD